MDDADVGLPTFKDQVMRSRQDGSEQQQPSTKKIREQPLPSYKDQVRSKQQTREAGTVDRRQPHSGLYLHRWRHLCRRLRSH